MVMPHDVGHGTSMEQAPVGHPVVLPHVMLSLSYDEDVDDNDLVEGFGEVWQHRRTPSYYSYEAYEIRVFT